MALLVSVGLTVAAMFAVRRQSRLGEQTLWGRLAGGLLPAKLRSNGQQRRRVRHVWANPVAWREAVARASTPSQRAMRWFIFIAGTGAAIWLLVYWFGVPVASRKAMLPRMQQILEATLIIEAVVAMVAAASAAGTSIARDRENGTFELMQTTPLTSQYILAGKLRGLVTLAAPMVVVPTLTALLFVLAEMVSSSKGLLNPASVIAIPIVLLTHIAVVAIIGMHISLRNRNTTKAVLMSVGTVLLVYLPLTLACWGVSKSLSIFASLNPIMFILTCVDPQTAFGGNGSRPDVLGQAIEILAIAAVGSAAILVGVWQGYLGMVKNFDFTLRKQT